ncbi:hypothetical protein ACFOOK_00010 [Micromonospora krabiensis]|uniref:hypothetical protein n=1 Tax=Micromonospora krabiensis TaxID=307121 RepID=UPI00360F6FCE
MLVGFVWGVGGGWCFVFGVCGWGWCGFVVLVVVGLCLLLGFVGWFVRVVFVWFWFFCVVVGFVFEVGFLWGGCWFLCVVGGCVGVFISCFFWLFWFLGFVGCFGCFLGGVVVCCLGFFVVLVCCVLFGVFYVVVCCVVCLGVVFLCGYVFFFICGVIFL